MRSAPRWRGFRSRPARFIGRVSPMIRRRSGASTPAPSPIRRRSAKFQRPGRKNDPPADIVNGQYRNRRYASVVPRPVFVGGKPVAEAMIALPARRLENAPLLAGSPGIEPQAASVAGRAASRSPPASGVAANLAKARDTLARIVKWREQKNVSVEIAVSRTPVLKRAGGREARSEARGACSARNTARPAPARWRSGRGRPVRQSPAAPDCANGRESRKPPKSHAAALRARSGDGERLPRTADGESLSTPGLQPTRRCAGTDRAARASFPVEQAGNKRNVQAETGREAAEFEPYQGPGRVGHRRRGDDRRAGILPAHARARRLTRRSTTI